MQQIEYFTAHADYAVPDRLVDILGSPKLIGMPYLRNSCDVQAGSAGSGVLPSLRDLAG